MRDDHCRERPLALRDVYVELERFAVDLLVDDILGTLVLVLISYHADAQAKQQEPTEQSIHSGGSVHGKRLPRK